MSLANSIVEHDDMPLRVFTSTERLSRVAFSPSGQLVAVGIRSRDEGGSTPIGKDSSGRWITAKAEARWTLQSEITALDWSPRSSESYTELAVAVGRDGTLAILTFTAENGPQISRLPVDFSSGTVQDIKYGRTMGQEQLLASVGDDGLLNIWNPEEGAPVKTIAHSQPLRSVSFHPTTASQILTVDSRGLARILNWQTSELLLDLTEPQSLAARCTRGDGAHGEWNSADGGESLGAVIAGRWVVWDLRRLGGGKPAGYGTAYSDDCRGREIFKWHPKNARRFATLCTTPHASPALKLYNTNYPQAPRLVDIAPVPLQADDMSWSPSGDIIAVVVGRDLVLVDASE